MSSKFFSVDGYGVDVTTRKPNPEKFKETVLIHNPELFEEMVIENDICPNILLDIFKDVYENDLGETGWAAYLADLMEDETGCRFEYQNGECQSAVMFISIPPFQLNEKEKRTTQREFDKLFIEYFALVGIDINENDIEYLCVEFYG